MVRKNGITAYDMLFDAKSRLTDMCITFCVMYLILSTSFSRRLHQQGPIFTILLLKKDNV